MKQIELSTLKDLLHQTEDKIRNLDDNIAINAVIEDLVSSLIGSEYVSLWVFDETKATLLRERDYPSTRELSMLSQRGVMAKCFLTLSEGIFNYLASEKEYRVMMDNPDNIQMKSKIILPLVDSDQLVGMVTAYSSVKNIKNFDRNDMDLLKALAPFLIDVLYKMHPHIRAHASNRVFIAEHSVIDDAKIVQKVQVIQEHQSKQELSSENSEVLNFLANTVHDIRTPANTLFGFLDLLEEQIEDTNLLEYISNAKESAHYINELTTSILDTISSKREVQNSKKTRINPSKFFADICRSFSANMYSKALMFNVYIDPNIISEFLIDEIKLKRVMINLIGNAYKFTPSHESINVTVMFDKATSMLHVSVEDTGIGIAKEKQSEIFESFKQVVDESGNHLKGTGLGLAICAEYVKELGGALKLKSELNRGSKFYFSISVDVTNDKAMFAPLKQQNSTLAIILDMQKNRQVAKNIINFLTALNIEKESISIHKSVSNVPEKTTHIICFENQLNDDVTHFCKKNHTELLVMEESFLSMKSESNEINFVSQYGFYFNELYLFISKQRETKILVVDDDQINIVLIKSILKKEFCRIDSVMDGQSALKRLLDAAKEADPYTLVYIDKNMPKLSGYEVIQQYREFEKEHGVTPIYAVYISGDCIYDENEVKLFNKNVGKPFNKQEIKDALQSALEL